MSCSPSFFVRDVRLDQSAIQDRMLRDRNEGIDSDGENESRNLAWIVWRSPQVDEMAVGEGEGIRD